MKKNFEVGTTLDRTRLKEILGGLRDQPGEDCTSDWDYDCSEACPCCSALCKANATNSGTICVPIFD